MFTVTETAKEKVESIYEEEQPAEERTIRIISSPGESKRFILMWDTVRDGDQVIRNEDEEDLIVVGKELRPMFDALTLDYTDDSEGGRFALNAE